MNLDLTNKSLEVKLAANVAANQLTWVAHYVDISQPTVAVTAIAEVDGVTNNTSNVAMVSAPGALITRRIQEFTIENTDTATATVTVQYNDNGTRQPICVITLLANSTLVFANGSFSIIPVPGTTNASTIETAATGTQNDFATGLLFVVGQVSTLICNNASLLTFDGFAGGVAGAFLEVISIGAGQVDFVNQSSGSAAGNRIVNTVTSIHTSLAPGVGSALFEYDGNTSRWRLVQHNQGAFIAYTPSWSASVTNPVLGNGTLTGNYYLRGSMVLSVVNMTAGSTTTFGSGFWVFSLPSNIAPSGPSLAFPGIAVDNDGGNAGLTISYIASLGGGLFGVVDDGSANLDASDPFTWATSDVLRISSEFQIS